MAQFSEHERMAEREVIGCIAASHAGYLAAASTLGPEDFFVPAHRRVFIAAAALGDDIANWHHHVDGTDGVHWHEATQRFWGLPDVEHVRVVAVADLAHVHAGELWSLVRARSTMIDETGTFAAVVAAAAGRRRKRQGLEDELASLDETA